MVYRKVFLFALGRALRLRALPHPFPVGRRRDLKADGPRLHRGEVQATHGEDVT